VSEQEAGEHERDAAHAAGEPPEAELPRVQVRERARHRIVQEVVVLQDEMGDVLAALEEPQDEDVQRIEEVQVRLQEHGVVRAAAEKGRAGAQRRVPQRQDPVLQLVVEVRLDGEAEVAAQVQP
jgi:hypothetical protein